MSFRLFIYYCALCGAAGAFLGWALGRWLVPAGDVLAQGVKALWLGLAVALLLGLLDAVWNLALRRVVAVLLRVLVVVVVGGAGGLLGGLVGQLLYSATGWAAFYVFTWALTGLLVGASLGVFDLLASVVRGQDPRDAIGKVLKGVLGGLTGGILGGVLSIALHRVWGDYFQGKAEDRLLSPSAFGFVALGACIGLLIGLAQVILKDAWLRVEAGFRSGRELILSRPETTLGRAEGCDVGLFGDPGIDRVHARIVHQGADHVLIDNASVGGVYVNGQRVEGARLLRSGDEIRLGRSVLRFGERRKKRGA
jgi:hypothetical protein